MNAFCSYNRIYKLALSIILTVFAWSSRAQSTETVVAEASIYRIQCEPFSDHIATRDGYGIVIAVVKIDDVVSKTLIFSAKWSVLGDLCNERFDLRYIEKNVTIDNYDPSRGGEIIKISAPIKPLGMN